MAGGWKLGTLLTYILRQVVQSRMESVLWQDDGSVTLVEKAYFSLKRSGLLTTPVYMKNDKCNIRSRNRVACIDHCHRPYAIVFATWIISWNNFSSDVAP